MYVVAIQLDDDTTDYKVFQRSTDAIARFDRYGVGRTVRKGDRSEAEILSMAMYKADTADVREAVRQVKAGGSRAFLQAAVR